MLNETLDKAMARSKRCENKTRASKYSAGYKLNSVNKFQESVMYKKIRKYVKNNAPVSDIIGEDISDYIVEDPYQIPVKIDFSSSGEGIPFFRSLYRKLLKV